jgi:hypothetical protein
LAKKSKKRPKIRKSGRAALIAEIKQLTSNRSSHLLNSIARDVEKITKIKALNSDQVKGAISKIIANKDQAVKKRSDTAKLKAKKKVAAPTKKLVNDSKKSPVKKIKRFTHVDATSTLLAIRSQEKTEKYWYENGGEKLTNIKEPHSSGMYPSTNDLRNEMGDQLTDDCGLAPVHQ